MMTGQSTTEGVITDIGCVDYALSEKSLKALGTSQQAIMNRLAELENAVAWVAEAARDGLRRGPSAKDDILAEIADRCSKRGLG